MGAILLLDVAAGTAAHLRAHTGHRIVEDVAEASVVTRRIELDAEVDAVVVGIGAREPVRLAQRAQSVDRDLGVLILADQAHHARLAGALRYAPFVSAAVRCVVGDPLTTLAAAVEEAAAQTARRRAFRQVEDGARARLPAASELPHATAPHWQRALEHAPIAILALDPAGRILASNRTAQEMIGLPERDLLGRNLGAGLEEAERAALGAALAASQTRGDGDVRPAPVTLTLPGATGEDRIVEATVSAMPAGTTALAVVMLQDVTAQRRMATELRASDRLASVGLLAAGVAHEINNPLTAVVVNVERAVASLEAAGGTSLSAELLAPMRDAREASERIRAIVRDLMLLARSEDEVVGPVDVEAVLQSTLRMAAAEIRYRARVVERYGGVPPVTGNAARLGQVFLNLVINAAQAMEETRADHNELSVVSRSDETQVVVEIMDSGPGIPPEVMRRLFTPFFTTKPPGEGTGLGLSICHRILTAMGGTIELESPQGRGTIARVTLPRASGAPAVVPAALRPVAASPIVAPRRRILLVEDDLIVLRATHEMLAIDFDVESVADGSEARVRAVHGGFDAVVCDLMMPTVTGMDLHAAVLAEDPALADRMVFMTGGAFTPAARAFLAAHPGRWIAKPFRPGELTALIASLVPDEP